jgi:DNA mismatch repair protein MutS
MGVTCVSAGRTALPGHPTRQRESSSGKAVKINPNAARQVSLFPETNPQVDELRSLDVNGLSPIEALNKLFEWQRKFLG